MTSDDRRDALDALRAALSALKLDGWLIPRADAHQGEYISPSEERLALISRFTGSAGLAAVLQQRAALLIDGRYTIQAREQVDLDAFELLDHPVSALTRWLSEHLTEGQRLGYDPALHTPTQIAAFAEQLTPRGVTLSPVTPNPIDALWPKRPAPPVAPMRPHPVQFAGRRAEGKLEALRQALGERQIEATLLSDPHSVAWLFNVRGGDVDFTPISLCHALIAQDHAELFIDPRKLTPEARRHLETLEVTPREERALQGAFRALAERGARSILIDRVHGSVLHTELARAAGLTVVCEPDLTALPRAQKHPVEQAGAREAHRRDGVAMCRFLSWLDGAIDAAEPLDELLVSQRLLEFRRAGDHFLSPSFATISGYGPHGAIVHYRATPSSNLSFDQRPALYLIDSGAQYLDGTTDITRVVPVGEPTEAMCRAFTLVLRGMIALSEAAFPPGTPGERLDPLARAPLWRAGLDYAHGTGHGVGSCLSVHEGPQRISPHPSEVALREGMILSNEPGCYQTDAFGIRIENLVMVTPALIPDRGKLPMHRFETLTLCPIDRRLIDPSMLSSEEIAWLDRYHRRVREELIEALETEEERGWLQRATAPLIA